MLLLFQKIFYKHGPTNPNIKPFLTEHERYTYA